MALLGQLRDLLHRVRVGRLAVFAAPSSFVLREVARGRPPAARVRPEETQAALDSFRSALETGYLQGLLDVLAPDVVFVSGDGLKLAALRPVVGADKVLRYLADSVDKAGGTFTSEPTTVNGNPGPAATTNMSRDQSPVTQDHRRVLSHIAGRSGQ